MSAYAYEAYKNTAIETASPGKLLLMLYDGAIRNLDNARQAILDYDTAASHKHLLKAQDIILELMCTLNMDYDIAKNLYSLYDFMYRHLVQANVKKDPEMVAEVRELLAELRATWDQAVKKVGSTAGFAGSEASRAVKA